MLEIIPRYFHKRRGNTKTIKTLKYLRCSRRVLPIHHFMLLHHKNPRGVGIFIIMTICRKFVPQCPCGAYPAPLVPHFESFKKACYSHEPQVLKLTLSICHVGVAGSNRLGVVLSCTKPKTMKKKIHLCPKKKRLDLLPPSSLPISSIILSSTLYKVRQPTALTPL